MYDRALNASGSRAGKTAASHTPTTPGGQTMSMRDLWGDSSTQTSTMSAPIAMDGEQAL